MEEQTQEQTESRQQLSRTGGRDELNLAEFPISVLSERVNPGVKTLYFEDEVFDKQANEPVKRKLTVTGSDAYGLPTAVDTEILVGLIQLTKLKNNFTEKKVYFSRYELLEILGWKHEGKNYARLEEALNRWMGVTLYYDKAWWNREAKTWVSEKFHILERATVADADDRRRARATGQQELALSWFTWNEVIFDSFQSDNLKRLNVDLYFALKSFVSKRVYRFLDKRFYHRHRLEFDLREFAFDHVGLSRTYSDNGKLKEKLQPALDELTEIGFLEPMSREDRYRKVSRGEWKIVLVKKSHEQKEKPAPGQRSELELSLIERGISEMAAAEFIAEYPADFISERIEAFDWMVSKKDHRVSKNPAGFLASSIRKEFTTPKGFESKAEREEKAAAARKLAEEERQRKAAEQARQQATEAAQAARIATYLDALSPDERATLEETAIAQTLPFFATSLRRAEREQNPEIISRYRSLIIDGYVQSLLDGADKTGA